MNCQNFLEKGIRLERLSSVILLFILCLSAARTQHDVFTIPFSALLILLIFIGMTFKNKINISCLQSNTIFLLTLLFCLLLQIIGNKYYFDVIEASKAIIIYYCTILACSLIISNDTSCIQWKIINWFSFISAGTIICQYFFYKIGIRLDYMPVLKEFVFNAWEFDYAFRPCGLFSEPSHFAELALISLYYFFFIKFSLYKILIICLGLVLSTSMLGILGIPLIVLVYIAYPSLKRANDVRLMAMKKFIVVLFSLMFLTMVYFYFIADYSWLNERIMAGGTAGSRIFRSVEILTRLDFFEALYGIGMQNQALYLNYMGIILESDAFDTIENREYAQTLGYILCTNGILGFMAFLYQFVKIFICADRRTRVFIGLFLIICFTSCVLTRPIFLIYLVVLYNLHVYSEENT